jgi:hypothetical protein
VTARQGNFASPADQFVAITPSDTTDIPTGPTRAIYVGTGGDISCFDRDGVACVFKNVPTGTVLPVVTRRVTAANTGASNLVAMF